MLEILTSILVRTIVAGTPLLLGTLGEVVTERAGILNLGIEGMMSLGAVTGFIVTFTTGNPWLGMIAAIIVGALFSLIHAFVTISLRANQVVSGLALTMLGLGLSGLWGKPFIGRPLETKMSAIAIPGLSKIPVIGKVLFYQDAYFYLSVLLGVIVWFIMKYTKLGITIRSVGENPKAAETLGINVGLIKYACVMVGGAFAGMAGAHLSTAYSKSWIEGMTSGRGWIVIALTIFALWEPSKAFLGAYVFGGIFVIQYVLQPLGISPNLLAMLPYLTTLGVLLFYGMSSKGKRKMSAPATLGEPYIRGSR
ncbi:ABC transporter permease [Oceanispirochaeta crateris]|uniref:ABC transporter permease n=1 Tax=Oceanispirochaeta crateris TaxID=2518645 RepID=A0A5C1QNN4_9SPIO|nr:ABC transporter permease [Oceanispirochaeta crateris]QEN09715.1 ABC transporter permease [Oceanispirochaeta crateris]